MVTMQTMTLVRITACDIVIHTQLHSDLILTNPLIWGLPVLEMNTLTDKQWIGASVMDFFLLHHWLQVHDNALMYYLDSSISFANYKEPLTVDEISQFRRRYLLHSTDPSPPRPIVFVALSGDHYFPVVFDYSSPAAFVFGFDKNKTGICVGDRVPWHKWHGPTLWVKFTQLYGWPEVDPEDVSLKGIDWLQVCQYPCPLHLDPHR